MTASCEIFQKKFPGCGFFKTRFGNCINGRMMINYPYVKSICISRVISLVCKYPVDTGRKLDVHKTFRRRPAGLLNVLCTLSLRVVSTGYEVHTRPRMFETSIFLDHVIVSMIFHKLNHGSTLTSPKVIRVFQLTAVVNIF